MINDKTVDSVNNDMDKKLNEVGGFEQYSKDRHQPDSSKTITPEAKNGELGGRDAMANDAMRYLDWINGNGDYGKSGRDFSFGIASLALVNPLAAGAILGTFALISAVHGIATSTAVRTLQAKRRLKNIYNKVLSNNGYDPSSWYHSVPGVFTGGVGKDNDDDPMRDVHLGPKPFVKYITSCASRFNSSVSDSHLLNANGEYAESNVQRNTEDAYATAGGFVASAVRQLYVPDSIIMFQKGIYNRLQGSYAEKFSGTKSYDSLVSIINDATQKNNASPIWLAAKEQLDEIKDVGDGICEQFDAKMSYALKKGRFKAMQSSKSMKGLWKKMMTNIEKQYETDINGFLNSEEYKLVRKNVEALSKTMKEIEIFKSLCESLNEEGIFARKNDNDATGTYMEMISIVDSCPGRRYVKAQYVNLCHLGSRDFQLSKRILLSRSNYHHYIEKKFSGDIKVGQIYRTGLSSRASMNGGNMSTAAFFDGSYIIIDDIIDGRTVATQNGTNANGVRMVVYHYVNFFPFVPTAQVGYYGGTLPEQDFLNAITHVLVEDRVQSQKPEGVLDRQSGTSESVVYDDANRLFEDGEEGSSEGEDKDSKGESEESEKESEAPSMADEAMSYAFVAPGRYRLDKDGKKIVFIRSLNKGSVKYEVCGEEKTASFEDWGKSSPLQLPNIPDNVEEKALPGPPRDIPNDPSDKKYTIPEFPITYSTFYSEFLQDMAKYQSAIEGAKKVKEGLIKYGLYVTEEGIGGIYYRDGKTDADIDFTMEKPYNFTPYIRSLGDKVLFETEESLKSYLPKAESTHESILSIFKNALFEADSHVNEEDVSMKSSEKKCLDMILRSWYNALDKHFGDKETKKKFITKEFAEKEPELKKIDHEALEKTIKWYKDTILTESNRELMGEDFCAGIDKRLDTILKDGINYVPCKMLPDKNLGVQNESEAKFCGRIPNTDEMAPDFYAVVKMLADVNAEIKKKSASMPKEDLDKMRKSSNDATEEYKKETLSDSDIMDMMASGGIENNNQQNTVVNNNISIDLGSLLSGIDKTKMTGDLDDNTGFTVPKNTPVEKPSIVKEDDKSLSDIIRTAAATIMYGLCEAYKGIGDAKLDMVIAKMKARDPEYYTVDSAELDKLVDSGDTEKIHTNDAKKLDAPDKKYIVDDGRVLVKMLNYDENSDSFEFVTEKGARVVTGTDTMKTLTPAFAIPLTEDTKDDILGKYKLDPSVVYTMPKSDFDSLVVEGEKESTTNTEAVNSSYESVYDALNKLYEDGDEAVSIEMVRYIIVDVTDDMKFINVKTSDGDKKLSIEKLKEIKDFDTKNVPFTLIKLSDGKYTVDKDYFNTVLTKHADPEGLSEVSENVTVTIKINSRLSEIEFSVTSNEEKKYSISYLYIDETKFEENKTDEKSKWDVKAGDLFEVTDVNEFKNGLPEHKSEHDMKDETKVPNPKVEDGLHVIKIIYVLEDTSVTFVESSDGFNQQYTYLKRDFDALGLKKYESKVSDEMPDIKVGGVYVVKNYDEIKELFESAVFNDAYYKLYGNKLYEFDVKNVFGKVKNAFTGNKDQNKEQSANTNTGHEKSSVVMIKVEAIESDVVTFKISVDNYEKVHKCQMENFKKFELEESKVQSDEFDASQYTNKLQFSNKYPVEELKKLSSMLVDPARKAVIDLCIKQYKDKFAEVGITANTPEEFENEVRGLIESFANNTTPEEKGTYNMLYSAQGTDGYVSKIVYCAKVAEGNYYFDDKTDGSNNKFVVSSADIANAHFHKVETNATATHESVNSVVTINRNKMALVRLYGGSLNEAVEIKPLNTKQFSIIINLLIEIYKFLGDPKNIQAAQQQNPEDQQNQQGGVQQQQTQQQPQQNQQTQQQQAQPQQQQNVAPRNVQKMNGKFAKKKFGK